MTTETETETLTATAARAREVLTVTLADWIGTEKAEKIAAAAAIEPETTEKALAHRVCTGEVEGLKHKDLPETIDPQWARDVLDQAMGAGSLAAIVSGAAFGDRGDAEYIAHVLGYVFGKESA